MSLQQLARALEVATDFVDAAGEQHATVVEMIAANDGCAERLGGTAGAGGWLASAIALHGAASARPDDPEVDVRRLDLVASIRSLAAELDMPWEPPPSLVSTAPFR